MSELPHYNPQQCCKNKAGMPTSFASGEQVFDVHCFQGQHPKLSKKHWMRNTCHRIGREQTNHQTLKCWYSKIKVDKVERMILHFLPSEGSQTKGAVSETVTSVSRLKNTLLSGARE